MTYAPVLDHIPGPPPKPIIGHTLDLLRNSYDLHKWASQRYGPIYKLKILGRWSVALNSAEGLEFILEDKDRILSSAGGWNMLHAIFPRGLMLRDFDDHRAHRRIMQAAFRKTVMDAYRNRMTETLDQLIGEWPVAYPFKFYPAVKKMTLQMGGAVFMGLQVDDPLVSTLNHAFKAEVAASVSPIRRPLPFTRLRRGIRAREYLTATFRQMIPERRLNGGDDFFSQMCLARDEDGNAWVDEEIVNHFNFLMMAAHDTTAASLAKMIWAIATYPEWQDRMIAEIDALGSAPLDDAAMASLDVTERIFKECLRLMPPAPFIPRQAVRGFSFSGVDFPAGTGVAAVPCMILRSANYWTNPDAFDPDRFLPDRAEDRSHRYAWSPFGGGAHKCIGLHFATMQVKVFMAQLLRRYRIALADDRAIRWQLVPIPYPKNGLPVCLTPRRM